MDNCNVIYVCQEIIPYLPDSQIGCECRTLSQAMQEKGCEIRTFMPRYGIINERRNQLHEVIRLSGMNLIIDDNDHQLIIKVASIPSARVQIYFIDNDDFFSRKGILHDPDTNEPYADNDERAIFFARGVLETVRKLRWRPTVVHCLGWFSAITPIYLKNSFADDPLFKDVKIVMSLFDDAFKGSLSDGFTDKIKNEGVESENFPLLDVPSYQNLMKFVLDYVDGVVIRTENLDPEISKYIKAKNIKTMDYQDASNEQYMNNHHKFYEDLF